MLFFTDEKFEYQDSRKLNEWSTERGSGRAARDQMLASEISFCCEQEKIANWFALWCYSAAVSRWFVDAPRDNIDQMRYAEMLAKKYAEVKDIRLMPNLDDDKRIVMELIWHQAAQVLTRYAELKGVKKIEPVSEQVKIPEQKKQEEKKPETKKQETKKQEEKKPEIKQENSSTKRAIGAIATAIGFIADKLPVNAAVKAIIKAVSWTIGAIFK